MKGSLQVSLELNAGRKLLRFSGLGFRFEFECSESRIYLQTPGHSKP